MSFNSLFEILDFLEDGYDRRVSIAAELSILFLRFLKREGHLPEDYEVPLSILFLRFLI
jgi:hypothetical protein